MHNPLNASIPKFSIRVHLRPNPQAKKKESPQTPSLGRFLSLDMFFIQPRPFALKEKSETHSVIL
jgi:hypothetical protein